MNTPETNISDIQTERVDDLPLLYGLLEQMGLQAIVDAVIHPHGNRQGLGVGQLVQVWLCHILSEQSHCLDRVQDWATALPDTLAYLIGEPVNALDFTDDRLADVLRDFSDTPIWGQIEERLGRQLIRVYQLPTRCVRLDSTTATVAHNPEQSALFSVGKTKAGIYGTQFKLMLGSLDPLGLPLATDVVSGAKADDPLYVPCYRRIKATVQQDGLLVIGDCKMSALDTRAVIVAGRDHYLMPYPHAKDAPDWLPKLLAPVWGDEQALTPIYLPEELPADGSLPDPALAIAEGFEITRSQTAVVGEVRRTWDERCLVVRSHAYAEAEKAALKRRLTQAEAALRRLTPPRGRGVRPVRDEAVLKAQVTAILTHHRVTDLLTATWERQVTVHRKRAYGDQPAREEQDVRYSLTAVTRDTAAIEQAERLLGWRIYLTNAPTRDLSLAEAVGAYREQYIEENIFRRLKGHRLSITPLYLHRDDHALGLVRLLTLAARLLAVAEYRVRSQLAETGESLRGLYAGQPQRATARPTTERLLQAFQNLTLTITMARQPVRHLTPLSPLQTRILALLDLSPVLYTGLVAA